MNNMGYHRRSQYSAMSSRSRSSRLSEIPYWIGEALIMVGLLLTLYYYVYLTFWTNHESQIQREKLNSAYSNDIAQQDDGAPQSTVVKQKPMPNDMLGIMQIPSIGVKSPILEGIGLNTLNRGVIGHYPYSAGVGQTGNYIVAAHRNGHGEVFRRLNRVQEGDIVSIITKHHVYKYRMTYFLPKLSPDVSWPLDPIPNYKSFNKSGKYITLITCTPEFTSLYRMVWFGVLVP